MTFVTYLQVKPAYGRTLKSKREVLDYYAEDKDFQILTVGGNYGSYLNKTDVNKSESTIHLEVRYGKRGEKVMILNPEKEAQ